MLRLDQLARCPLCGAADLSEACETQDPRYDLPGRFKVLWCSRCEIGSTYPQLSSADLEQYYPDEYDPYQGEIVDRRRSTLHRFLVSVEERFGPGVTDPIRLGSLLDVGCGDGRYLAAMSQRGFDAWGVEISRRAAKTAAKKGLHVLLGDFLQVSLPPESFDVVTMNHYLEHSLDPRASLQRARALLRQAGQLVVGVPNFASWAQRRFGPYWSDLEVPRHAFHFTPRSLVGLLEECGFHLDRVTYVPASDSGSVVTSLLVKNRKRNDPLAQKLYPFLHLACYPIGIPLSILRQSAWIRVFSTKA